MYNRYSYYKFIRLLSGITLQQEENKQNKQTVTRK